MGFGSFLDGSIFWSDRLKIFGLSKVFLLALFSRVSHLNNGSYRSKKWDLREKKDLIQKFWRSKNKRFLTTFYHFLTKQEIQKNSWYSNNQPSHDTQGLRTPKWGEKCDPGRFSSFPYNGPRFRSARAHFPI